MFNLNYARYFLEIFIKNFFLSYTIFLHKVKVFLKITFVPVYQTPDSDP